MPDPTLIEEFTEDDITKLRDTLQEEEDLNLSRCQVRQILENRNRTIMQTWAPKTEEK